MIDLTDCMVYAVAFVREFFQPASMALNDEQRAERAHMEAISLMELRKRVASAWLESLSDTPEGLKKF